MTWQFHSVRQNMGCVVVTGAAVRPRLGQHGILWNILNKWQSGNMAGIQFSFRNCFKKKSNYGDICVLCRRTSTPSQENIIQLNMYFKILQGSYYWTKDFCWIEFMAYCHSGCFQCLSVSHRYKGAQLLFVGHWAWVVVQQRSRWTLVVTVTLRSLPGQMGKGKSKIKNK